MKKILAILAIVIMFVAILTSCGNYQIFDTVYEFDRAIISLPNGKIIEGSIDAWRDYEEGDQIQVKVGGVTYLVHSSDIVLIKER